MILNSNQFIKTDKQKTPFPTIAYNYKIQPKTKTFEHLIKIPKTPNTIDPKE